MTTKTISPLIEDGTDQLRIKGNRWLRRMCKYLLIPLMTGMAVAQATTTYTGDPQKNTGVTKSAPNFVGMWSAKQTYMIGQLVIFNNISYISMTSQNLNNVPNSSPTTWSQVQPVPAIVPSPTNGQTIQQPSGTTLAINNINGVLNATLFPGTDLGAQVAAAITELNRTCGTVMIPAGAYYWTTPKVQMLPCQTFEGSGAIINTSTGTAPALIFAGNFYPFNSAATQGGLRNVTFAAPGTSTGSPPIKPTSATASMAIWFGGGFAGDTSQGTANPMSAALMVNIGLHVENYGTGLAFGNAYQIAFLGGSIEGNYDGIGFPLAGSGLENINFHGTQIINNLRYGINSSLTTAFVDLNLYGCSLDYNASKESGLVGGAMAFANGTLNIYGGWIEDDNAYSFISLPGTGAAGIVKMNINGLTLSNTAQSGTADSFLNIIGVNNKIHVKNVITNTGGITIPSLFNWTAAGTNNLLEVEGESDTFQGNAYNLPVLKTGQSVQFYKFPVYDSFGDISGYNSSFSNQSLKVTTSVLPGAGLQHVRAAGGCATAPTIGATCTTPAIVWPTPFADSTYTLSCTLSNPTGEPVVSSVKQSAASFTVTIAALTASAAGGDVNCIALHP